MYMSRLLVPLCLVGGLLHAKGVTAQRLDVFSYDQATHLTHKYFASDWGPPGAALEGVGIGITGNPSAVSWDAGRLDIVARGPQGELLHKFFDGNGWNPNGLGGPLETAGVGIVGDPTLASWEKGRLDVVARGPNGELLHKYFDGNGWNPNGLGGPLESLGVGILGKPVVVSWGKSRLDIFARGAGGELLHKFFDGQGWGPAGLEVVGTGIAGDPVAIASRVSPLLPFGRLDIFARGPGGELLHKFYAANGNGWNPNGLGGPLETVGVGIAGDPTVTSWGIGRLDIFARGPGGELLHKYFDGTNWNPNGPAPGGPLETIGVGIAGDPTVASWGNGRLDVVARGPAGELLHKYYDFNGSAWNPNGLGGPLEVVGGQVTGNLGIVAGASFPVPTSGGGGDPGGKNTLYFLCSTPQGICNNTSGGSLASPCTCESGVDQGTRTSVTPPSWTPINP
jgi:hypothetical protein